MSDHKLTIAIDGYSSCGKSTLARMLAKKLGYIYIDSGAMYRAVTLYLLDNGAVDVDSQEIILDNHLDQIDISFVHEDGRDHTLLNGVNVEKDIRSMRVSQWVSEVAALSPVRKKLVLEQRSLGQEHGIVMDGRDIGTVVFPDAELKLFVTASIEIRAQRRHEELKLKGLDYTIEEVRHNLLKRDHIDSSRTDSPLMQADDAIVVDNTHMDREQQLEFVLGHLTAFDCI